jgi:hypothetical protein
VDPLGEGQGQMLYGPALGVGPGPDLALSTYDIKLVSSCFFNFLDRVTPSHSVTKPITIASHHLKFLNHDNKDG